MLQITKAEGLALALRLSVDSCNLNKFEPMKFSKVTVTSEKIKETFPKENRLSPEKLTISRFCAVYSDAISKYLKEHPDQIWGNGQVDRSIDPSFCFPHCYYVSQLSTEGRAHCMAFLATMDRIMAAGNQKWRPLSLKAANYFKQVYNDEVTIDAQQGTFKIVHK